MISLSNYKIIDISQPVSSSSACFPGDTPFSKNVALTFDQSKIVNLTAMTLSPHVGTHADAPSHICGDLSTSDSNIGILPLEPYMGSALVVDLSPFDGEITFDMISSHLKNSSSMEKIIFKTQKQIRYDVFEEKYAYFSPDLINKLASIGVNLVGIDTPSVDHINSKDLETHHVLHKNKMVWLENLDLTKVVSGTYFLIALPLKLLELEASPVRAILLAEK